MFSRSKCGKFCLLCPLESVLSVMSSRKCFFLLERCLHYTWSRNNCQVENVENVCGAHNIGNVHNDRNALLANNVGNSLVVHNAGKVFLVESICLNNNAKTVVCQAHNLGKFPLINRVEYNQYMYMPCPI